MRITSFLSLVLAVVFHTTASSQVPGLPTIDFQRYFPHLIAVSEEKQDKQYPNGVQYKFVTVRDEQEKAIILALTRREGPTRIVRVFLAKGPLENSEATLRSTVTKFSGSLDMKFEVIGLRDIKTLEDFKAKATDLGWGVESLHQ